MSETSSGSVLVRNRPGVLRTLWLCLRESRPVVQIIYLGRFLTGAFLVRPVGGAHLAGVAIGALAWFATVAAVYVFNGLQDLPEDVANGSLRPLASGELPASSAWLVTAACCVTALGLGAVHPPLLPWILVMLGLGWAYSSGPLWTKRRGWSASLTTFGLGLCTYAAGATAAGGGFSRRLVVFALAMSLWIGLVGAIAKDLTDVPGDALAGRRTLAVARGPEVARAVTAAGALGTAALLLTGAVGGEHSLLAPAVVLAAGASSTSVLARGRRFGAAAPYRAFMLTQYAVHVALAVTLAIRR